MADAALQDQTPEALGANSDQPVPWSAVVSKPEFQALPDEQKEMARQQYYKEVVEPQVPDQYKNVARKQFEDQTGPKDSITKKAMDYIGAPFAGFQRGVNDTILGTIQGGAQIANKLGIENTVGEDIQRAKEGVESDDQDYYGDNTGAKVLNKVGEGAEKVGEFSLLAGKNPGYLKTIAAGTAQGVSQPANDLLDRSLHGAVTGAAAGVGKAAGDTLGALFPGKNAAEDVSTGVIPKSGGQITQNAELQKFETLAAAGKQGPEAEKAAIAFRKLQNDAYQKQIDALGANSEGETAASNLGTVQKIIKDNHTASSKAVDAAYDAVRATNKETPIQIPNQDIVENLLPKMKEISDNYGLDKGVVPAAKGVMETLGDKLGMSDDASSVATKLDDLEAWRRMATNVANKSSDPAVRSSVKEMVGTYDNYMSGLADRAPPEAADAIGQIKEAVAARREHGRMFENNDLVDDMIHGNKSVDDLTKQFFGGNAIGNKQDMLENFNAMMKAAGPKATIVREQVQNGFAQNMFNRVQDGKLPGGQVPAISAAKLKTELTNMFIKQRELATSVFGTGAVNDAQSAIKELGLITSKQPYTTNPSGTAFMSDTIQKANNVAGFLSKIPVFSTIAKTFKIATDVGKSMGSGIANAQAASDAEEAFAGKIPGKFATTTPQQGLMGKFGTQTPALAAAAATTSMGKKPKPNSGILNMVQ